MLQVLEPPTKTSADAINTAPFIVTRSDGQPVAVQIDYALYLALQEDIEDWYAGQRAAVSYAEYLRDPSTVRPWAEFKAELIAEGLLDAE